MEMYKFDSDANIIGLIPNERLAQYKNNANRKVNFLLPFTVVDFLNTKLHYDYHYKKVNRQILTCEIDVDIKNLVKRKYSPKWETYFDIYENYPEFDFMRPLLLNTAKINITSNINNLNNKRMRFIELIGLFDCSTKNVEIKTANYTGSLECKSKNLFPYIKTLEVIQLPTSPLFMGIFYNKTQTIDCGINIQHRIIYPMFINTADLIENEFTVEKLITIEINKDIIITYNKENGNVTCEVNNFDYYDLKFIINLLIYLKNFFL